MSTKTLGQPMQEMNFTVTLEEANLILEGLGLLPFARVYALVGKIQEQAGSQLHRNHSSEDGPGAPVRLEQEAK
jgi:hypothetical protein